MKEVNRELEQAKAAGTISVTNYQSLKAKLMELKLIYAAQRMLFLPPHPARSSYNGNKSWIVNACEAHLAVPLKAIVSNQSASTKYPVIAFEDVDASDEPFCTQPHIRPNRTAEALIDTLDLLLSISSEIAVIDPHFKPNETRYQSVIPEILRRYPHIAEVHLFTKHFPQSNGSLGTRLPRTVQQDDFKNWTRASRGIPSLLKRGQKIHVTTLTNQDDGDRLHARYILTDVGGVMIDPGLDVSLNPSTRETFKVTRLTCADRDEYWDDYVGNKGFDPHDTFTICG